VHICRHRIDRLLVMLRRLHIRNYLLIDALELELGNGLNIITGETGSGKSILLGALALATGERADAGTARDTAQRCVVELEVDLGDMDITWWFAAQELPYERLTLLRRQIEPGGRSRAFINDTPVRLEQLRELGGRLIHIHSQHHTLLLNDPTFQLGLVDHLAGVAGQVRDYRKGYQHWRTLLRDLEEARRQEARAREEFDFLQFQWQELDQARMRVGEEQQLTEELGRAEHAEEIRAALEELSAELDGERGLLNGLSTLRQRLVRSARVHRGVDQLMQRLEAVRIELKDIAQEGASVADSIEVDPLQLERLRDRSDLINRLLQKHRRATTEELLALQEQLALRIAGITGLEEHIAQLEHTEQEIHSRLKHQAVELSSARQHALKSLGRQVEELLHELGMPHARFRSEQRTVELGPHGMDSVRALFSANTDREPAPLDKVASGGELSRVMLAMISLAAASQDLRTVIFDEIDTGVSGEVADRVGGLMSTMGHERQVVAITHLPQIASKGDRHFSVSKEEQEGQVRTRIRPLEREERVRVIARMLSGSTVTKQAQENARVLLQHARSKSLKG
jgi:DNA repair protein RecN (Recombination protein N)